MNVQPFEPTDATLPRAGKSVLSATLGLARRSASYRSPCHRLRGGPWARAPVAFALGAPWVGGEERRDGGGQRAPARRGTAATRGPQNDREDRTRGTRHGTSP